MTAGILHNESSKELHNNGGVRVRHLESCRDDGLKTEMNLNHSLSTNIKSVNSQFESRR